MMNPFEFVRAESLDQALQLLAEGGETVRPLAGGTDIVPGMQQGSRRFSNIEKLVDISHLNELHGIDETPEGVSIGAAATFSEVQNHPRLQEQYPLLTKAVSTIGSLQIRNRATIGGNFVNNAPCADSVPPLLVYEARLRIRSASGERSLSLQEFLQKPYRTQLRPDELVTEILLPRMEPEWRGDFYKLGRRRGVAISRITLAVLLKLSGGKIGDMRIAAGAVTPIGKRFPELETTAQGMAAEAENLRGLAIALGRQVLETTGLRWSTPYKLPVTQQMFYELLCRLCGCEE